MEKFYPGKEFEITKEGEDAAVESALERLDQLHDFDFIDIVREQYPESRIALVGGFVRDTILGLPSKDYDLVVEGIGYDNLHSILDSCGKTEFVRSRAYGVLIFKPENSTENLDIALPRSETYEPGKRQSHATVETENISIEQDFSRRDFTINAMGLDLVQNKLIDPFGGLSDIREHKIRAVGDPIERFKEDPTRILRGIRFAAKYDFDIDPETLEAMKKMHQEIKATFIDDQNQELTRVSPEKIGEELFKTIDADPVKFLDLYEKTGLLDMLLPEISALKGVEQPRTWHTEGDVYTHTRLVASHIPHNAPATLKFAALFHDLGKVASFKQDENGKITFYGHEKISSEISDAILNRYRYTVKFKENVHWLIGNHMKILKGFPTMRLSKQKTMARNPLFPQLVALSRADTLSSISENGETYTDYLDEVNKIYKLIQKEKTENKPVEIINGDEIIEIMKQYNITMNYKAQLAIGKIKNQINEEYDEDKIINKDAALSRAAELIKKYIN